MVLTVASCARITVHQTHSPYQAHLMRIWSINRSSLKVFLRRNVHGRCRRKGLTFNAIGMLAATAFRREITMTMFNATQRDKIARIDFRRGVGLFLSRLGRLINRWVAATIARHERQADLAALRQLSDRELQDIGLCRGDIGEGLAEAAKSRIRLQ